jgi:hypothetical protein
VNPSAEPLRPQTFERGAVLPGDRISGHVAGVGEITLQIGPAV